VKEIRPNHDTNAISKRNTDFIMTTTPNDHCTLPEHDEEFPTFIFKYNKTANLDEIIKSVKEYNSNSTSVLLAVPIELHHMIIFKMNRAAYLQVCYMQ